MKLLSNQLDDVTRAENTKKRRARKCNVKLFTCASVNKSEYSSPCSFGIILRISLCISMIRTWYGNSRTDGCPNEQNCEKVKHLKDFCHAIKEDTSKSLVLATLRKDYGHLEYACKTLDERPNLTKNTKMTSSPTTQGILIRLTTQQMTRRFLAL